MIDPGQLGGGSEQRVRGDHQTRGDDTARVFAPRNEHFRETVEHDAEVRVRFAHLWRGFGYSLVGLGAFLLLSTSLYLNDFAATNAGSWYPGNLTRYFSWVWVAAGLWLCAHWTTFATCV